MQTTKATKKNKSNDDNKTVNVLQLIIDFIVKCTNIDSKAVLVNGGFCLSINPSDHVARGLDGGAKYIPKPYHRRASANVNDKAIPDIDKALSDTNNCFIMCKSTQLDALNNMQKIVKPFGYYKHVAFVTTKTDVFNYMQTLTDK